MMMLIGSRNLNKIREIREILADLPIQLKDLRDFPDAPGVEETGATFRENAEHKARVWSDYSGLPTLADDSGLVVDALGGRPGVHSARYAGDGASDAANIEKLMNEMKGISADGRTAHFRCVCVVAGASGVMAAGEGHCEGRIAGTPRGRNGFGYDPLFLAGPDFVQTFAEIPPELKNRISHRARAISQLRLELIAWMAGF